MPLTFEVRPLRFRFRAIDEVRFPPGKAGNTLRGAIGTVLPVSDRSRIFSPSLHSGPSGLADPPRPFVIRAHHLNGARLERGADFHFDIHWFYPHKDDIESFRQAVEAVAREGLGASRGRARLETVEHIAPLRFDLACEEPAECVLVRFLTPTELKEAGRVVDRPEFPILFARIRDRISTLRGLYGPGPLDVDFRVLAERAAAIRVTRCQVDWERASRRSSRTGQVHPLGGLVGEAEYEGALSEFLPWLRAAQWTGVGRQTVWGKGAVEILAVATSVSRSPSD